jgi:uncharacterized protein (UPF0335 family)
MANDNLIINDEALRAAVKGYEQLEKDVRALEEDIKETISILNVGFNTPAGQKYIAFCRQNLLKPVQDQATVVSHLADSLRAAENAYRPVFQEYQALQEIFKNAKQ